LAEGGQNPGETKAPEWLRLAVEGHSSIQAAWEARGSGVANTVTPEGWKLFGERLELASDRLKRSWEVNPSFALTATSMITVSMGLSLERDEMETWFRHAMETDPDCLAACRAKATYLQPKWHGSVQDYFDFAYQCYRTKNWHAHLPLMLDSFVYSDVPVHYSSPEFEQYYRQPQVFEDMKALYEGYLAEYPDDRWAHTRYATILVASGRPAMAVPQFEALGNRPWTYAFHTREIYEKCKERAFRSLPKKK